MSTAIEDKFKNIEDVQGRADLRQIAINKVGIKAIEHPITVNDSTGNSQHTVGNFSMYVNLPHNLKGTHMSRFIEILENNHQAIDVTSFGEMMKKMTARLEAEEGFIEMSFPYFIMKEAPISKVKSLLNYQVKFIGERKADKNTISIQVTVPVTSLCPCSKGISDYGAHNQRSHITITATLNDSISIEELVSFAEKNASCELFGILKRPDEKYVTERAYDNPKFVEDIVRDVAASLNAENRIDAYVVESENFESIHNHSAYALIQNDKRN